MSRRLLSWVAVIVLLLVPGEVLAIINGTLDTSFECVGSLHDIAGGSMACTGTLINESWVLTAASCASAGVDLFAMGYDWLDSPRVYVVDYVAVHPSYSGASTFDFALMHLAEPATGEPVCAPLTAGDDLITAGSTIIHVGFGITSYPSGLTSQRHYTNNQVDSSDGTALYFSISGSGPCIGDFGGPALRTTDSKVAGVISTTDETCSAYAIDGRASAVYATWIVPTIDSYAGIFLDCFELGTTERWTTHVP